MNLWPQYTYLALCLIGVGVCAAKHGEPKTGTHNFLGNIAASSLILWILYMGGFFKGLL